MHLGSSVGLYVLYPLEVHQGVVPGELLVGSCWFLHHLCQKLSHVTPTHETVYSIESAVWHLINDRLFSLCVCPPWVTKPRIHFCICTMDLKKIIDYDSHYKLMWFPIRDTILSIITVIGQNISRNHRHLCLFSYYFKIFFILNSQREVYTFCAIKSWTHIPL